MMCQKNKWPEDCLPNYKIGAEKCEICDAGEYGCNCSSPCGVNRYGVNCYETCHCTPDEICDPRSGCLLVNISTKTPETQSAAYDMKTSDQFTVFFSNITTSFLVSLVLVLIVSVICGFILIRSSKRYYKREYQRMVSNLTEGRSGNGNEDHGYSTAESLINFRLLPSGGEENTYDHTDRGDYHILSLRRTPQRAYVYDEQCPLMTSFHPQTPPTTDEISPSPDIEDLDIIIEPECLTNLFREAEDNLFNTVSDQESISEVQSDSEKGNDEHYTAEVTWTESALSRSRKSV